MSFSVAATSLHINHLFSMMKDGEGGKDTYFTDELPDIGKVQKMSDYNYLS